jgi:hypothetical protein
MIVLPPYPPLQSWLKAFWVVITLVSGLTVGAFLSLSISGHWFLPALVLSLLMALPGLKWPQIASFPYRAWNKLAREFARLGQFWLLLVCFYIVFVVVGKSGSSLCLARPAPMESMWKPRRPRAPSFRGSAHGIIVEPESLGWASAFNSWAAQSGNAWAWFLWPFLMLLSAFHGEDEKSEVPANVYTLF